MARVGEWRRRDPQFLPFPSVLKGRALARNVCLYKTAPACSSTVTFTLILIMLWAPGPFSLSLSFSLSSTQTQGPSGWFSKMKGAVEQVSVHLSSVSAPHLHGKKKKKKKLCVRSGTKLSAPAAHGESSPRVGWPLVVNLRNWSDGGELQGFLQFGDPAKSLSSTGLVWKINQLIFSRYGFYFLKIDVLALPITIRDMIISITEHTIPEYQMEIPSSSCCFVFSSQFMCSLHFRHNTQRASWLKTNTHQIHF